MRRLSSALLLTLALGPATAKVSDGLARLSSQDTEMFVAKFSFSPYQRAHLHGHFEPKGSTGQ